MLKVKAVDKISRRVEFEDENFNYRMIVFVPISLKTDSIRITESYGFMTPWIKKNLNKYYAQASAIINETKKKKLNKNQISLF